MGNNIILETKFVADISGSFNIPSYQRGYRWSETEVVRLLDDIYPVSYTHLDVYKRQPQHFQEQLPRQPTITQKELRGRKLLPLQSIWLVLEAV